MPSMSVSLVLNRIVIPPDNRTVFALTSIRCIGIFIGPG